MSFLVKRSNNRTVSIKMKSMNFSWVIAFPLVMIGAGLLEVGRLLWVDGMHGLQMLASTCRDMIGASSTEVLSLLPYTADSFSQPFWLIGGGVLCLIGSAVAKAIIKHWEFFSTLNYFCNLLAESTLMFAPCWVTRLLVFPIQIFLILVACAYMQIQIFLKRKQPFSKRNGVDFCEADLRMIVL